MRNILRLVLILLILATCFTLKPTFADETNPEGTDTSGIAGVALDKKEDGKTQNTGPEVSNQSMEIPRNEQEAKRIKKESQFATLRNRRQTLVRCVDRTKKKLISLFREIEDLTVEERRKTQQLRDSQEQERKLTADLDDLRKRANSKNQSDPDYKDAQMKVDRVESTLKDNKVEQSRLQADLRTIRETSKERDKALKGKQQEYDRFNEDQSSVDNEINTLLIPETEKNNFKLWITGAFSLLVLIVILGFFYIARIDPIVRQSIFSCQSGIQFLTLFSIVIAIILFGITDILEGKELAALLGGLSGYILGHVSGKPASEAVQKSNVSTQAVPESA